MMAFFKIWPEISRKPSQGGRERKRGGGGGGGEREREKERETGVAAHEKRD